MLGTVLVRWTVDDDPEATFPDDPFPVFAVRWDTELVHEDLVVAHAKQAVVPFPVTCPAHPDRAPVEAGFTAATGVLGRSYSCTAEACGWTLDTPGTAQVLADVGALWRAGKTHKRLAHRAVAALHELGQADIAEDLGRSFGAPSPYAI